MLNTNLTPLLQFSGLVVASGLFAVFAYFTRATRQAVASAFAASLIFTGLNVVWDLLAYKAGWWSYPGRPGPFQPLSIYLAQNLVWGGAFGLVGWRVHLRFGVLATVTFILLLSLLGNIRDFTYASRTEMINFGAGVAPRVADFACWVTLIVTSQVIICFAGGSLKRNSSLHRFRRG